MDFGNVKRSLKEILKKSPDRKPLLKLLIDLTRWTYKNRGGIFHFYQLGLHLNGSGINDYLTDREYSNVHDKLDPVYYRPLLEDKIIFDRYIRSFNIPTPDMIGIIENGTIFWTEEKKSAPLHTILDHPMEAFCKLTTSWGGKNIYKIEISDGAIRVNNRPSSVEKLKSQLGKGKFILQRKIIQHEQMDRLNPNCVNTIRVYTKRDGVTAKYMNGFVRMGVGDSFVDNVSSSNLAIGLKQNHRLMDKAYKRANPPQWFPLHPTTNIRFTGFEVPFHHEAINLCRRAHHYFSDFFIVAWDVAITDKGPVILEGNPAPSLIFLQVLYGGLKKDFLQSAKKFSFTKESVDYALQTG